MNEMIERVARAIQEASGAVPWEKRDAESPLGENDPHWYRDHAFAIARAAIEAMRDPTGWMALAGENVGINWLAEAKADMTVREARPLVTVEIYKGMINAALNFGATSAELAKEQ